MEENFILVLFILSFVLTSGLLYLFFYRFQQHKRTTFRFARLFLGNVLVFLFLCAGLVFLGEIRYRYFYDATDSFGLTKTTQKWFQRHFHYNGASFRDSIEYPLVLEKGKPRATFVGDSFTAGHGIADVEDRFVNRVRAARPDWDVQMFAKCGWDTRNYADFLGAATQSGYQLDLVVLVYCLNDISDIVPEWEQTLHRIYESSQPGFFASHSYLFNTFYFRYRSANDPDLIDYYQFIHQSYENQIWDAQQSRLKELDGRIRERGGRLVVVTFPFVHAINEDYPYRETHVRLARFWDSINVPHLDLLPVFEKYDSTDLIVNSRDSHPNEKAHQLASEAILDFLDGQINIRPPEADDEN